jgi:hypothetical protein
MGVAVSSEQERQNRSVINNERDIQAELRFVIG